MSIVVSPQLTFIVGTSPPLVLPSESELGQVKTTEPTEKICCIGFYLSLLMDTPGYRSLPPVEPSLAKYPPFLCPHCGRTTLIPTLKTTDTMPSPMPSTSVTTSASQDAMFQS